MDLQGFMPRNGYGEPVDGCNRVDGCTCQCQLDYNTDDDHFGTGDELQNNSDFCDESYPFEFSILLFL